MRDPAVEVSEGLLIDTIDSVCWMTQHRDISSAIEFENTNLAIHAECTSLRDAPQWFCYNAVGVLLKPAGLWF